MNLVWRRVSPGEVGTEQDLSLERVLGWLLSRKPCEVLMEHAALSGNLVRVRIECDGSLPVEFVTVHVRPESELAS